MISLKTDTEISVLAQGGVILAHILDACATMAKPGVTLLDIDARARDLCRQHDATPAFLGYRPDGANHPYPAAICASLNDVVVHGVPNGRALRSGDVLKIDMGVIYRGLYTDSATTVTIGPVAPSTRRLIASTRAALEAGIAATKIGGHIGDIGYAIERQAHKDGFFVLRGLTGHGVGHELHEDPVVFNYGKRHAGGLLKKGMVLALEPMFAVSSSDIVQNHDESYSSADGSMTAHFEHTIALTDRGIQVLTRSSD
ncbi:MAG: type I methionyl aminopeptidase [Candidatus Paceibacterota bacterium]|jgi:methionyl aminopeptidase